VAERSSTSDFILEIHSGSELEKQIEESSVNIKIQKIIVIQKKITDGEFFVFARHCEAGAVVRPSYVLRRVVERDLCVCVCVCVCMCVCVCV
jgi:hypothetical protein